MVDQKDGADHWLFLNDWPMRKYLMVMTMMIIGLLLFELARMIFGDSAYTNLIGYLLVPFIVFFPGAAALRALRLHDLGFTRSLLYSLPLGIAFLMATGFLLNILHYANIMAAPLTFGAITVGYPLILGALMFVGYRRDRTYVAPSVKNHVDMQLVLTIVLAVLLPFVVIVGTQVADYSGSRDIILYGIIVACLAPLVVLSHRIKHYELLVLSLSMALLFHRALMTNYLIGYDIFTEYSGARYVITNGFWNIFVYNDVTGGGANTSLAIVTLAPMLSNLTSIEPVQLLKIVYPFLFAFVPLAVFKAVQSQFGSKAAFLGACIFMGYQAFYVLMIQLTKQQIAEIFLVSLLLLFTDPAINKHKKKLLVGTFIVGVMVSHYAIAYISLALLAGLVGLMALDHLWKQWVEWRHDENRVSFLRWFTGTVSSWWKDQRSKHALSIDMFLFAVVFFLIWFSVTAGGMQLTIISTNQTAVSSGATTTATTTQGVFTLSKLDALESILIDYGSPLHNIDKYLVLIAQMLGIIGVVYVLRNRTIGKVRISDEFLFFGVLSAILVIACYTVPNLSTAFYYGRFFHVEFLFLCGFLLIGVYAILSKISLVRSALFKKKVAYSSKKIRNVTIALSCIFVILFMLFNTSVAYMPTTEYKDSFSLDEGSSWAVYSNSDVAMASWLSTADHHGSDRVMADWHHFTIFSAQPLNIGSMVYQIGANDTNSLIYLTTWNEQYGYVYPLNINGTAKMSYTPLNDVLRQLNGHYDVVYATNDYSTMIYLPHSEPTTNAPAPPIYTYETTPFFFLGGVAIALIALLTLSLWAVRRKS